MVRQLLLMLLIPIWKYGEFYEIGETESADHQYITYPICYGEYPTENLQLSHFNGYDNGGIYKIIWIEMLEHGKVPAWQKPVR